VLKLSVASLLLAKDQQLSRAARLAKEVYTANPGPVLNAAVYAYSLFRLDPSSTGAAAAAAILDARPDADKNSEDCLVYYGLILAACNRTTEAGACFSKMNRSMLFPETLEKVRAAENAIYLKKAPAPIPPER